MGRPFFRAPPRRPFPLPHPESPPLCSIPLPAGGVRNQAATPTTRRATPHPLERTRRRPATKGGMGPPPPKAPRGQPRTANRRDSRRSRLPTRPRSRRSRMRGRQRMAQSSTPPTKRQPAPEIRSGGRERRARPPDGPDGEARIFVVRQLGASNDARIFGRAGAGKSTRSMTWARAVGAHYCPKEGATRKASETGWPTSGKFSGFATGLACAGAFATHITASTRSISTAGCANGRRPCLGVGHFTPWGKRPGVPSWISGVSPGCHTRRT